MSFFRWHIVASFSAAPVVSLPALDLPLLLSTGVTCSASVGRAAPFLLCVPSGRIDPFFHLCVPGPCLISSHDSLVAVAISVPPPDLILLLSTGVSCSASTGRPLSPSSSTCLLVSIGGSREDLACLRWSTSSPLPPSRAFRSNRSGPPSVCPIPSHRLPSQSLIQIYSSCSSLMSLAPAPLVELLPLPPLCAFRFPLEVLDKTLLCLYRSNSSPFLLRVPSGFCWRFLRRPIQVCE